MTPTHQGSFRLFQFAGIDVFLHWSWFLVALFEVQARANYYSSVTWNVLEYLSLFAIVLLHEFGHALACRQVGGQSNQIVLWPLGGVAYVAPPPRPGATLWSIAAGPLVNVALLPFLSLLWFAADRSGWSASLPNVYTYLKAVWTINLLLLIFNLLPIYPMDGGQILRSLLWFIVGRARSLVIATVIGFVGVAGLVLLAFWAESIWFGILAFFILLNCWKGWQHARLLTQLSKAPRRAGAVCPNCKTPPPAGPFWMCGNCRHRFDTFENGGTCPNCGTQYAVTACWECEKMYPIQEWVAAAGQTVNQ